MFLKSLVTVLGAAVAVQSLPADESANKLAKPCQIPGSAEYNTQLLKEKCDTYINSPACMKAANRCAGRFAASEKIETILNCTQKAQYCLKEIGERRQNKCEEFAEECQKELGTISSDFYRMAECTCKKQVGTEGGGFEFCVREKTKL